MSTAVVKETRDLAMHPKLLMDTIKRQAGSLEKANLEGIMNAIEAGSEEVRIGLTVVNNNAILSIHDDGIGIETKKELIAHFETFGTPHEASENTYWKQFRMGRGQMFAFGKNIWRTATFQMIVDIEKNGLTYELHENLPYIQGCQITIELYTNPLNYAYSSIEAYKEHLTKQIRFMDGRILFNGEQINTPAKDCKWDFEDENAYYLFNAGNNFSVYNLGAYVMDALNHTGMCGIVVSKQQVKVNFARNDIQHDCTIYNEIKEVIKKNRIKKTRQRRRSLNSREKTAALKDLRDNTQEYDDIKTLALIPTAQGKYVSLEYIKKLKQQWCFAPEGDRVADGIMEKGRGFCFDDSILETLGYRGAENAFFIWLTNLDERFCYRGENPWVKISNLYVDYEELSDGMSDECFTIPEKKWRPTERKVISVLQQYECWDDRQILLGSSNCALAWTDGSTYICLDRKWLNSLYLSNPNNLNKLLMVMAHEMAHNDDTRGSHIHGPEFYENMVRVLELEYDSPAICAYRFFEKMKNLKIEEKREKELKSIEKAQEKVNEKLGIAAKSKS